MSTTLTTATSGIIGLTAGLAIALAGVAVSQLRLWAAQRRLQAAQRQLRAAHHDARHDPLTGLPNRRACYERLHELLAAGKPMAVIVLDLDGFKAVNDAVHHSFGDRQLIGIAASLTGLPVDLVARLGGDEFALLVHGGPAQAHLVAVLARNAVARAVPVPDSPNILELAATAGIALAHPGDTPGSVLHRADQAERHAKRHRLGIYFSRSTDPA